MSVHSFNDGVFPTYLAHLYGGTLDGRPFDFITEVSVFNPTSSPRDGILEVELQGYSEVKQVSLHLEPGQTASHELNLMFDYSALYSVSGSVDADVMVRLLEPGGGGTPLDVRTRTLTLAPKNTVFWKVTNQFGDVVDNTEAVAVMVTPHDRNGEVSKLLTEAADRSATGSMAGFQLVGASTNFTLTDVVDGTCRDAGQVVYPPSVYKKGETKLFVATVDVETLGCAGCDSNASYLVLDQTNYDLWQQGKAYSPALRLTGLGSGKGSFTPKALGAYYHLVCNPSENIVNRNFRVERTLGVDETWEDQVGALYWALHDRGMDYTTVSTDFFKSAQYVRTPGESLRQNTANCIDGTLVFASALEAIGMFPTIIVLPTHAVVGTPLYLGPDMLLVALDTTVVYEGDLDLAIKKGMQNLDNGVKDGSAKIIHLIDARQAGFLPMPL